MLCVLVMCWCVMVRAQEDTTYTYPTATWTAVHHEALKQHALNKSKLYLFKPSPFLKPPFTENNDVNNVDDEVTLSRGKTKWKESYAKAKLGPNIKQPAQGTSFVDLFLEESLKKYLNSSNLKNISVEAFTDTLQNVTRRLNTPYDKNKELRIRFRDEVLMKRKPDSKNTGGILEKQLQKRLQSEKLKERITLKNIEDTPLGSSELTEPTPVFAETTPIFTETTPIIPDATPYSQGTSPSYFETMPKISKTTTFYEETTPTVLEFSKGVPVSKGTTSDVAETTPFFKEVTPSFFDTTPFFEETTPSPSNNVEAFEPRSSESVSQAPKHITFVDSTTRKALRRGRGRKRHPKTSNDLKKVKDDDGELKLSVAETVYYRKRQYPVQSPVLDEPDPVGVIPGVPYVDYPMYSNPPSTGFKCPVGKGQPPKIIADTATRCQVFYVCTGDGPAAPTLCPNGTMFNEKVSVCDWWYNVNC